MLSFRFVFMEIFESEKREKCLFYIIFSQKTEHGKKKFPLQKMSKIAISIYDNNLNFLPCKITKLEKTQFCWEPYFCPGRPDRMLAFWNFSRETVILRMLSSTSSESFSVLGWSRCNSWTFSKEQPLSKRNSLHTIYSHLPFYFSIIQPAQMKTKVSIF
jgi:hypothetical protein